MVYLMNCSTFSMYDTSFVLTVNESIFFKYEYDIKENGNDIM